PLKLSSSVEVTCTSPLVGKEVIWKRMLVFSVRSTSVFVHWFSATTDCVPWKLSVRVCGSGVPTTAMPLPAKTRAAAATPATAIITTGLRTYFNSNLPSVEWALLEARAGRYASSPAPMRKQPARLRECETDADAWRSSRRGARDGGRVVPEH